MSYHLNSRIDLARLDSELVTAVSAIKTLSYLVSSNAEQIGSLPDIDGVEITNGIGDLLGLVASSLHTSSCTFSNLHDQLTYEGGPLPSAHVALHVVGGLQHGD
jgi:hypothetical protein